MKAKTPEERAFKSKKKRQEEFAKYQYEVFENTALVIVGLTLVISKNGLKAR